MNFLDHILKHYLRESDQGIGAAIFGGILLIGAALLWKFAIPATFLKGLTIPFLIVGLIMGIGGGLNTRTAKKNMKEGSELYQKDQKAFFDKETVHVEKVHKSWRRVFGIWSLVTLAGLTLLFTAKKSYGFGVAAGLIIVSVAGHIEETISKRFNEKYYHEVLDEAKKTSDAPDNQTPNPDGKKDDTPTNNQQELPENGHEGTHHVQSGSLPKTTDGPILNIHLDMNQLKELDKDTAFIKSTVPLDSLDNQILSINLKN